MTDEERDAFLGSIFYASEKPCGGCGKPLAIENSWMEDGCPCNSASGCNNLNMWRWHLLQALQQKQSHELEAIAADRDRLAAELAKLREALQDLYELSGPPLVRHNLEWEKAVVNAAALLPEKQK